MKFGFVLTLALLLFSGIQAPGGQQQRAIVTAWNQLAESIDRENPMVEELNKSMHLNPPWRVVDARQPARRAELIDQIIAEHKKRIELLEKIKKEDGQ